MHLYDFCIARKLFGGGSVGDIQFTEFVQRTITAAGDSGTTSIGELAFSGCDALETADFPNVTEIGNSAFIFCEALSSVSFPNATIIAASAFRYCTSLTSVDFPNVISIEKHAFGDCSKLDSLILHKRATLKSANAISSQTVVYVENTDLEWYSTAAIWSTIYNQGRIKPISELPTEGGLLE